ncbi:hypothetical protein DESUT3_34750 [Desulfuromonas versatilis]|uniref:MSHA biogenesis protein MshK n=1 Tax=Desulfuromonas versatilis TaxID=2802975 RepID=A0ABM8HZ78_9BACT|nr:hypothetical protein [Desulfuromonas versatilis]BCR06406.1 hypothetical protein DESUT3_34750 [Desulfuromonas versatilis]
MSELSRKKWFSCCILFAAALALAVDARGAELRDPTRPPIPAAPERAPEPLRSKAPDWRLSSILVSPERRVAVISGQAVVEGDRIDGARVVAITPSAVLLQKGKREYTLNLTPDRLKEPSAQHQEGK